MCFLFLSLHSPPPGIMMSGSPPAVMTPKNIPSRLEEEIKENLYVCQKKSGGEGKEGKATRHKCATSQETS